MTVYYRGNTILNDKNQVSSLIKKLNKNFILFYDVENRNTGGFNDTINDSIIKFGNNAKQCVFIQCYKNVISLDYGVGGNERIELYENDYIIMDYNGPIDCCCCEYHGISDFYYQMLVLCESDLLIVYLYGTRDIYGIPISDLEQYKDSVYYKYYKYNKSNKYEVCFYNEEKLNVDEFMYVWEKIYPRKMTDELMKKLEYTGMFKDNNSDDFCKGLDEFHNRDKEIMECLEKEGIKVDELNLPKVPTVDKYIKEIKN